MRHCRLFKVSIKLGEPQVGPNYSSMVEQRLLGTTMRMTEKDQQAILETAHQCFDERAEVYLFGSRIDDSKKGGDIDLYIIPGQKSSAEQLYNKKIKFLVGLDLAIGDQKIDVVIAKDKNRLIEKEAIRTGVRL